MGYLLHRLLQSAASLLVLVTLVFVAVRLTGDPANLYLPLNATAEARDEFNERHGFHDPLVIQYGRFLGDIAAFDLGTSLRQDRPALDIVIERFPTTLQLGAVSLAVATLAALLLGSLAAVLRGRAMDRTITLLSIAGASTPDFWVAVMGILWFAVYLDLVPTSGMGGATAWVLPVVTVAARPFGILTQVTRGSMIDTLGRNFIKTGVAKGLRPRRILYVHGLRNALIPAVTVASDQAAGIINGAVIAEVIFGWPGVGRLMIDAITQRDFAVVQAAVMVVAVAIFVMNILVDALYTVIDPRVRLGEAARA